MSKNFTGSVKALLAQNITANGHKLNAGHLSNLVQLGLITKSDQKIPTASGKGKPADVLNLTSNEFISFDSVEQTDPAVTV